jgi:hypothetical protein
MILSRMLVVTCGTVMGFTLVAAGIAMPAAADHPPAASLGAPQSPGPTLAAVAAEVKAGLTGADDPGLGVAVCVDLDSVVRIKAGVGLGTYPCASPEVRPSPDPSPPAPRPKPTPTRRATPRPEPARPEPARPEPVRLTPPPPAVRALSPSPTPPSPTPKPPMFTEDHPPRDPMAAPVRRRQNPLGSIMVLVIFSTMIATAAGVAFTAFR